MKQKQFEFNLSTGFLWRTIFIFIVSLVIWCNKSYGQSPKQQDSVQKVQQEADKFVDSLMGKATLKDFEKFLDEGVPPKQIREASFGQLKSFFLQVKYNEWMEKKKQKKN